LKIHREADSPFFGFNTHIAMNALLRLRLIQHIKK